jgi:hypothetical protein
MGSTEIILNNLNYPSYLPVNTRITIQGDTTVYHTTEDAAISSHMATVEITPGLSQETLAGKTVSLIIPYDIGSCEIVVDNLGTGVVPRYVQVAIEDDTTVYHTTRYNQKVWK